MSRHVTQMTIDDAEHYSPEERQKIIDSYLPHERDARARGVPVLGSGRVFPISEDKLSIEPFAIPEHWPQIGGMDFGWDHPFAAVSLCWDRDWDRVYVTRTYKVREETPLIHAGALVHWGKTMPWAWPHDGLQHDKGSGDQLCSQYEKHGLNMLPEKATHEAGGFGTEAGISEMLDRMKTDRFKVFSNLEDWWFEFRMYHRKDGLIVKERDDLMSATRIGLMMLRKAEVLKSKSWDKADTKWVV